VAPERLESIPRSVFRVFLSEAPPPPCGSPRFAHPLALDQSSAHPKWRQVCPPGPRQVNITFNAASLFGAPPQQKPPCPIPFPVRHQRTHFGCADDLSAGGNRCDVCLVGSWLWTRCVDGRPEVLLQHRPEQPQPPDMMLAAEPRNRHTVHRKIGHHRSCSIQTIRWPLHRVQLFQRKLFL
jgi:hypothetical protein